MSRRWVYSDLMMDPIVFHGKEVDLLRTAEMARLTEILQLSTVYMFHPNATHTRWHHSIGVAGLTKSFIKAQPPETTPTLTDQYLLVSAALLHDTGHSAWSHVGEVFAAMRGTPIKHDMISARLVQGDKTLDRYFEEWDLPRVAEIVDDPSHRKMIADLILGRPPVPLSCSEGERRRITKSKMYMANMINGPACFDIAEYIMRDSFMCTSFHGLVDLRSMVENLGIVTTAVGTTLLAYTNLNFAEALILALELQYSGVYLTCRNLVAEELLIRVFDRAYPPGEDLMAFWLSTDQQIMDRLRQAAQKDDFVDKVLRLMRTHQTYSIVDEINLSDARLDEVSKTNIRYLGGDEGRPTLLQFEKDICRDLGLQEGDIVIGSWIWEQPKTAQASIRIGEKDTTVASESRLLEVLRTDPYVDSRSKLIIGADHTILAEKGRDKIVNSILERLRTEDYTLF